MTIEGQLPLNKSNAHTFSLYFRSCILGISDLCFATCLGEEEAGRWERSNQTKGRMDDEEIIFIIFLRGESDSQTK